MTYETIVYEKRGRVAYLTLNRPKVMNAINLKMREELLEVWLDFRDDPDVWCAILTGAGEKAFSAGADLKDRFVDPSREEEGRAFWETKGPQSLKALEVWKPIIAAVNGYCLAGGLELMMQTDIRIAAQHATFGLSEVLRSLVPGSGPTQLPRQVPYAVAMYALLTGERMDAEEALRIGFINKVVPATDLMATAQQVANRICENGPLAVRAIKEIVLRGQDVPYGDALRINSLLFHINRSTEDAWEGPRAFVEKRKPVYKGR